MLDVITLVASLSGPFEGLEHARRPPRVETFWRGLPAPSVRSADSGIIALRSSPERRIRIPGGHFVMGSTPSEMQEAMLLCAKEPAGMLCDRPDEYWSPARAIRAEGHAHEVTIDDFMLDATEVTVERYARCAAVGACGAPSFPIGDPRYDVPSFPVTHVTWQDAVSYCTWAGGRLPTEAEWELAARGRVNNPFPWGKLYNPRLANHGAFGTDPVDARDGFAGLAPVGSFPDGATPAGVLDLAGNAAEWVFDWYDRDEQQFGYARKAQTNPQGPPTPNQHNDGHVVRGGSYRDGAHELRAAARHASPSAARDIGFRCAATL